MDAFSEVGSGIGNISQYFIDAKSDIVLSDIREEYCNALLQKFPKNKVLSLDLVHPDFENAYSHLLGSFDSCFAMNVIEHIVEDDHLATKKSAQSGRKSANSCARWTFSL